MNTTAFSTIDFRRYVVAAGWTSMPHNEVSVQRYQTRFKETFADYLNQYARRYPNFHILGDVIPSYPSQYFGDDAHLNQSGALKWSDTVARMLNDAKVPGGPFGAD